MLKRFQSQIIFAFVFSFKDYKFQIIMFAIEKFYLNYQNLVFPS